MEWSTRLALFAAIALLGTSLRAAGQTDAVKSPVVETGDVYYIGQDIPVPVKTDEPTVAYKLEWVLVDQTTLVGHTYDGVGAVRDFGPAGRVAMLPTAAVARKGVYLLSGDGIDRRRILLVDPVPDLANPLTWAFSAISSSDQVQRGAPMAEEFLRVGIRCVKTGIRFSQIIEIGKSDQPDAGKISDGFDAFLTRANRLGLKFMFQPGSHYSQIEQPDSLDGPFYEGLRRIQKYYAGRIYCWSLGNEVNGGGYSRFTPKQYADVVRNMSAALKSVDPDVKLAPGELYSNGGYLDMLVRPEYARSWDILTVHKVVGVHGTPCAGVSDYLEAYPAGVDKPVWDTEVASGCIWGGPSAQGYPVNMRSWFPHEGYDDEHGGLDKSLVRSFCLETRHEGDWLPAFYKPGAEVTAAENFFIYHYNGSGHTLWALRKFYGGDNAQHDGQNHKVAGWRTACDMLHGAVGYTRIPNTDVADPHNARPKDKYVRADGYVYRYGPEYMVILWQNAGQASGDREMTLTCDPGDAIVLYDSFGNACPLANDGGKVKVWVPMDTVYLRGFTALPRFALAEDDDEPYFVTEPIPRAVVGQTYWYDARAYDPDVPRRGNDSLPRIRYQLVDGPEGMVLAANADAGEYSSRAGLLRWTPGKPGKYAVRVRAVSDHGRRATAEQSFTIDVAPVGESVEPVIFSRPMTTFARVGWVWRYNVRALDPAGGKVTFALDEAPEGMAIDPGTGFVQWTPAEAGEFPVRVRASAGGKSTEQSLTVRAGVLESPKRWHP